MTGRNKKMNVFGIDLGTCYSSTAMREANANAGIISGQTDASDTLASVVWFESEDNVVVGTSAKDMVVSEGDKVVKFIKREIDMDDAKKREFCAKLRTMDISDELIKRIKGINDGSTDGKPEAQ